MNTPVLALLVSILALNSAHAESIKIRTAAVLSPCDWMTAGECPSLELPKANTNIDLVSVVDHPEWGVGGGLLTRLTQTKPRLYASVDIVKLADASGQTKFKVQLLINKGDGTYRNRSVTFVNSIEELPETQLVSDTLIIDGKPFTPGIIVAAPILQ